MNRFRTAAAFVLLGALVVVCEPAPEQGPRALAGIGLDASANSGDGSAQGTITRRIGPDPSGGMFAPFPDGTRMAIMHWGTADLSSYDLETGETTRITGPPEPRGQQSGTAMNPVLSSDGTMVAYTWNDFTQYPGELQLRVRDVNGGEPRQLYTQPGGGWFNPEDWSEDGHRLLVLRTLQEGSSPGPSQMISVSAVDGAVTVLKQGEREYPATALFSPDGRYVAFDNPTAEDESDWDVFVLPSEGGSEAVLVGGPGNDRLMGWAPDGRSVLFLSDRGGTPGAWLQPVADGRAVGDPYLVKADLWNVIELDGFDGEGRYYYQVRVGARALNEVTLAADGRSVASEAADLTSREYAWLHLGRWSPDGRHIAMTIARNGHGPWGDVLLIRSADSGEEREVRMDGLTGNFNDLAWTPDGQSVIAAVVGDGRQTSLVKIDVRTGEAAVLMELGHSHLSSVAVSPDGGTVYYTQQDYSQLEHVLQEGVATERIMALELATGATRVVHQSDPGTPTMGSGLAISPDGTMLAFGFIPRRQGSGSIDERRLYVIGTRGGAPRLVADAWYSTCTWATNGDGLLCFRPFAGEVTGDPQGRLVRVDVTTGEVTPLGLEGDSYGVRGCLSLHPNGRRLLFAAGEPTSEWWVMEGFLGSR
jgi:Tol biopolymer transport system component